MKKMGANDHQCECIKQAVTIKEKKFFVQLAPAL